MNFGYELDKQFSVNDCTYVSGNQGVIFSPVNLETIMCSNKVVEFVELIEGCVSEQDIKAFLTNNHLEWDEIIKILLKMHVIYELS